MTARHGAEDRIKGLELGADDYLVKPVDPEELSLKVRNLAARVGKRRMPDGLAFNGSAYEFDGCVIDFDRLIFRTPMGEDVRLTKGEFALMRVFVDHAGETLTREKLVEALYTDARAAPLGRAIDNRITRLRRKIEANPRQPTRVVSVFGMGYKLAPAISPLR